MSSIRRRFLVAWNGGDTVQIETNAWDMVVATDQPNKGLMTFALVHNALQREKFDVPKLHAFVTQLDELEDISDSTEANPTIPPVLTDEQLLSH